MLNILFGIAAVLLVIVIVVLWVPFILLMMAVMLLMAFVFLFVAMVTGQPIEIKMDDEVVGHIVKFRFVPISTDEKANLKDIEEE